MIVYSRPQKPELVPLETIQVAKHFSQNKDKLLLFSRRVNRKCFIAIY